MIEVSVVKFIMNRQYSGYSVMLVTVTPKISRLNKDQMG